MARAHVDLSIHLRSRLLKDRCVGAAARKIPDGSLLHGHDWVVHAA